MPGSSRLEDVLGISGQRLREIIENLKYKYPLIFVDSPTGVPFDTLPAFEVFDYQIIVVEIERSPIYSFETMVENEVLKLKALGDRFGLEVGVVINKVREASDVIDKIVEIIETEIGVPVLGVIPFDDAVPESVNAGIPVLVYRPHSDAAIAFKEAGQLTEEWIFGSSTQT
ncbi:hypothetical protein Py04_1730 [Pyrococcus sp. ST04]|nr:hypothetical protein Py04_1730 [Pyrococcus sp. ST04]